MSQPISRHLWQRRAAHREHSGSQESLNTCRCANAASASEVNTGRLLICRVLAVHFPVRVGTQTFQELRPVAGSGPLRLLLTLTQLPGSLPGPVTGDPLEHRVVRRDVPVAHAATRPRSRSMRASCAARILCRVTSGIVRPVSAALIFARVAADRRMHRDRRIKLIRCP